MSELIELQELRIGNILSYKGELHYVSFLSLDIDDEYQEIIGVTPLGQRSGEKSDWNRAMIGDLLRVQLTDEWLLKFKFEPMAQDEEDNEIYSYGDFEITKSLSSNEFWLDANIVTPDRIKYVHQIQNIHFALTGTELAIS
jgi:hypothetical protein